MQSATRGPEGRWSGGGSARGTRARALFELLPALPRGHVFAPIRQRSGAYVTVRKAFATAAGRQPPPQAGRYLGGGRVGDLEGEGVDHPRHKRLPSRDRSPRRRRSTISYSKSYEYDALISKRDSLAAHLARRDRPPQRPRLLRPDGPQRRERDRRRSRRRREVQDRDGARRRGAAGRGSRGLGRAYVLRARAQTNIKLRACVSAARGYGNVRGGRMGG